MRKNKKINKSRRFRDYLEKTKYYGVSNSTFVSVMLMNKYKKRALDLGCGALRDSKFLSNCGYIVDAVDKRPEVKEFAEFTKQRPKKTFNLLIKDYTKMRLGKEKYQFVNAQNTLSFNTKKEIEKLFVKILKCLKKNGYFAGNFFGPKDTWKDAKEKNMRFYTKKEVKQLLKPFKIVKIWVYEGDGTTALGDKKHWHIINFIVKKV